MSVDISRFSNELTTLFVHCLHREPRGEFTPWLKKLIEMRANGDLETGEIIDLTLNKDELTLARWAYGDAVLSPVELEGVLFNGVPAIELVDSVPA